MLKSLKRTLFVLLGILVLGFAGILIIKQYAKKNSPEETITHTVKDATFTVFYNRPFKRNREIFGKLVPYGEVWRTGANEPTTFSTDKDIMVDGTLLKAGTYSVWTIPNPKSWKVIFNAEDYAWGINLDGSASREPEYDVLAVEVPVQPLPKVVKQFSVYFENANDFTIMSLAWDKTAIAIPIKV